MLRSISSFCSKKTVALLPWVTDSLLALALLVKDRTEAKFKKVWIGKGRLPPCGRSGRGSLSLSGAGAACFPKWSCSAMPDSLQPKDCSPPGSSVHGLFQARVLEWVAISFSRGSTWPRDRTWVSHVAVRLFTIWATRESPSFPHPYSVPGRSRCWDGKAGKGRHTSAALV